MNLIWKRSNAKVMYQNYTLNVPPDVAVLGKRTEVRGSMMTRGGGGRAKFDLHYRNPIPVALRGQSPTEGRACVHISFPNSLDTANLPSDLRN